MQKTIIALCALAGVLHAAPAITQASEPENEGCRQVHDKVAFCGAAQAWAKMPTRQVNGVAMFRNSATGFGKVIVENIKPGQVTRKQVENAILFDLAAKQAGPGGKFSVDRLEGGEVDGKPVGSLEYDLTSRDSLLRTLHSYVVQDDLLIQFITITSDSTADTRARSIHKDFLGGFQITKPAPLL